MSRTSLGQKQARGREQSSLRQLGSVRRANLQEESFQTHCTIDRQVEFFLHMKERYQKVQKEHRFFNLEEGSEAFSSVRDGYGINIFKNGDRYIGFWEKNTMHGMGIYVFKGLEGTPVAYLGEFFYGKFHGLGKLVRMLDDQNAEMIYRGTWVQGRKGEQGVYFYDNPSTYYQGNWFNDQKHGEGRLVFPYGEFIGSWQANKREGPGRLRKASPSLTLLYEGNWQADELPEGQVTYLDSSGAELGRYKGQLLGGKRHGKGVYSWRGGLLEGSFQDDRIKGEGTLKAGNYTLSGYFYSKGQAIEDAQNLQAVIEYSNGDVYEGRVRVKDGAIVREEGIYRFAIGDVAEGRMLENGQGKLEGAFGYRWRNGEESNF